MIGLGERVQEPHGLHEVRGDALQQQSAFDERFAHEPEVELLEVADAAVHELRRAARGAAGPVALLDEADAQAAGRGIQCRTGSDDAAADHEDVEFLAAQRLDGGGALGRAELRRAGDGVHRSYSALYGATTTSTRWNSLRSE